MSTLRSALNIIQNDIPRTQRQPAANQIIVAIDCPIDRRHVVINESIPRALIKDPPVQRKDPACVTAIMDLFHDTKTKRRMITRTWSRLRMTDPTIKPWKLGEKITGTNLTGAEFVDLADPHARARRRRLKAPQSSLGLNVPFLNMQLANPTRSAASLHFP